jgi:hypothetical protein
MNRNPEEKRNTIFNNPMILAITAGFITLISGIVTTYYKNEADRALERQKFESELVLKAISTGDKRKAAEMLKFLVQIGYIKDESGQLKMRSDKGDIPTISYSIDSTNFIITPKGDTLKHVIRKVNK